MLLLTVEPSHDAYIVGERRDPCHFTTKRIGLRDLCDVEGGT